MTKLARTVWVEHDGVPTCFTAGSTPPAWATDLITNPTAWASHVDESPELIEDTPEDEHPTNQPEEVTPAETKIPPLKGKGSSAAAWAEYAKSQGFEVEDDDAKASEIRDALIEAGVPVE